MPELPEVETIRRGLGKFILNKKIVQVEVREGKSFIGEKGKVEGVKVVSLGRRGKALLIGLDNGYTMMIHLRMTGQVIWRKDSFSPATTLSKAPVRGSSTLSTAPLRASLSPSISSEITSSSRVISDDSELPCISSKNMIFQEAGWGVISDDLGEVREYERMLEGQFAAGHPSQNFLDELPNKQTRVIFVFEDGKMFFNDQRKFGFVKVLPTIKVEQDKFIRELGKEPWEMETEELFSKCQRHGKSPIKAVLLDQKVIAGLGNIYADEALFFAGVHPTELAGNLDIDEVGKILEGAREVMSKSIELGGSTMATYLKPDGTTGDYLEKFAKVYGRANKKCVQCGAEIEKIRCAGRGTHFCPNCQKVKGDAEKVNRGGVSKKVVQKVGFESKEGVGVDGGEMARSGSLEVDEEKMTKKGSLEVDEEKMAKKSSLEVDGGKKAKKGWK